MPITPRLACVCILASACLSSQDPTEANSKLSQDHSFALRQLTGKSAIQSIDQGLQIGNNTLFLLNDIDYAAEPFLADLILSDLSGQEGRIGLARLNANDFSGIKLGIGLGDPQHKLHLHNGPLTPFGFTPRPVTLALTNEVTGKSPLDGFQLGITRTGEASLGQKEALPLTIETDAVPRIFVGADGLVGIGTTTPTEALSVAGLIDAQAGVRFPDGSTLQSALRPPLQGALVTLLNPPTTSVPIPWDTEIYDTTSIWDPGQPTRLTAPTGAQWVRLTFNVRLDQPSQNSLLTIQIRRNGSYAPGLPATTLHFAPATAADRDENRNASSTAFPVSPGDYFELHVEPNRQIVKTNNAETWFALEVLR